MSAALTVPAGVAEARALTDALDGALVAGFARLTPDARAALDGVAAAVAGSPLGPTVAAAVEALGAGALLAQHLGAVAAARAALDGAACDALLAVMAEAAGLVVEAPAVAPTPPVEARTALLMESARQWLVEIALAGLGQLDRGTIAPAVDALRALQDHPPLRRLAALMTGLAHELHDAAPTGALTDLPRRRWADLWTTALLATRPRPSGARSRAC